MSGGSEMEHFIITALFVYSVSMTVMYFRR